MFRIVLAVVVGAAVVAITVRLFIVPVSVATVQVYAVIVPGSVSEDTFSVPSNLAMDAGPARRGGRRPDRPTAAVSTWALSVVRLRPHRQRQRPVPGMRSANVIRPDQGVRRSTY